MIFGYFCRACQVGVGNGALVYFCCLGGGVQSEKWGKSNVGYNMKLTKQVVNT